MESAEKDQLLIPSLSSVNTPGVLKKGCCCYTDPNATMIKEHLFPHFFVRQQFFGRSPSTTIVC